MTKSTKGISNGNLEEIVTVLNILLDDEYALYTKTRNVYWNAKRSKLNRLSMFIKNQYEMLDVMIGDIAEQLHSFGHFALGSLSEFMSVTHIDEENYDFGDSRQIIQTLVNDHETIIRRIKSDITPVFGKYKDFNTTDLVTVLKERHEKMAWMLKSCSS